MSLRSVILNVMLAAALLMMVPDGIGAHEGVEEPVRETGDVIEINSDGELEDQAELYGWPGSGSETDPFLIQGLEINGTGYSHCIYIGNTTHHFIIKDCEVYGVRTASEAPSGITLFNVINGVIENTTAVGNGEIEGTGIWLNECTDILVTGCRFADNGGTGEASVGVYVLSCDRVVISDSRMISNVGAGRTYGVFTESSSDLSLSGLHVLNSTGVNECAGIYLEDTRSSTIENCRIVNNSAADSAGIVLDGADRITVSNCELLRNQFDWDSYGIYLMDTENSSLEQNTMIGQSYGLYLERSHGNLIADNRLEDHRFGFFLYHADDNWIENNTVLETELGNFGSCPFLYTWNGNDMELIGDVNGMGGLGYSFDMTINGGGPMERRPPTSKDHTAIDASSLEALDGSYILEMVEEQDEITYFDQAELWVIDHPPDVEIYNPEAALCTFEPDLFSPGIHTVKDPVAPVTATDWNGNDILDVVSKRDGTYTNAEILNDNHITVDLGDLSGAEQIKLIYSAYTDWSPIGELKENVHAEVIGIDGRWEPVSDGEHLGKPEALPRTYVMDITDWFRTDDYRLRLHTGNIKIHVDWIAVDTTPDEPVTVTVLEPSAADHYFKGPVHPTFERFQGEFTKYGDVLPLLMETDDMYVIMKDGDAVELRFPEQPAPLQERDFWLVTDAYFKQPFVKHLLEQEMSSVGPLPFHSMSNYPYPPDEAYPSDPEHTAYLEQWNTRTIRDTEGGGMSLPISDNNTVIGNLFRGDPTGYLIQLVEETNCSIIGNEIYGGNDGILSIRSKNILIKDNIIDNCSHHGIYLSRNSYVELEGNRITDSNDTGLYSSKSDNVTIYNNYFDNELNWNLTDPGEHRWNVSLKEGRNILGGDMMGGNYWSDYNGVDMTGDMMGDTLLPYGPGDHLPLVFENFPPEITDTTSGTPTTGDPFTFSAEASDLGGVSGVHIEYWFDGSVHINRTMESEEEMIYESIVSVPDTVLNVSYRMSVEDASGNWNSTSVRTKEVVDNDGPWFRNLTYPPLLGIGQNSTVSVRIYDNIEILNVSFMVELPDMDRMEINHSVEGDLYSADLPVLNDEGWMNISIRAVDAQGNMNWSDGTLSVIDDIAPQIEILNPANGSHVSGTVGIALNISDVGSGVELLTIDISGTGIYNSTPEPQEVLVVFWNTTEYEDGNHTVHVSVWDGSWNLAEASAQVTVKNNFTEEEELRIVSTSPADQDVDVPIDVAVKITFSVPVDTDLVFISASGAPEYEIAWENNDTVMVMNFQENLTYSTIYTIWIDSAFSKIAAPLIDAPYELTFTTRANHTADDDDTADDDVVDDDVDDDTADDDDSRDDNDTIPVLVIMLGVVILLLLAVILVLFLRRPRAGGSLEEE
ncbi:MAG: NosD domain-containing protein [Thermoplasmatota archaeon]